MRRSPGGSASSWALVRQQAALSAAMARQQKLAAKAESDAKRLEVANQVLARGDVRVAGLLYARLAATRTPNASSEAAKRKLSDLQVEAQTKLDELDRMLASGGSYASGTDTDTASEPAFDKPIDWNATEMSGLDRHIVSMFEEYEQFVDKYGGLPGLGTKVEAHVAKLKRRPIYAAVLNEPEARELWDVGQKHERDNQFCCAYWVYKQTAELMPAPSAARASARFAELAEDKDVIAAAETCKTLKWCHAAYVRAEKLLSARPDRAKEVFGEILERAPEDSEVYRAARTHVDQL